MQQVHMLHLACCGTNCLLCKQALPARATTLAGQRKQSAAYLAVHTAAVDPVLIVVDSRPGVQPMLALQEKERNLWADHAPATALNSGALLPTNAAELQAANAASTTSSSRVHLHRYTRVQIHAVNSAALKKFECADKLEQQSAQTGGAGGHREANTACIVFISMC
jgi:hypothetical protein